jgi:protein-ribulosamine 3-kinase
MHPELKQHIAGLITRFTGSTPTASFTSISGGSINETLRITAGNSRFLCKINAARTYPKLFEKEAAGLEAIRQTACISTPRHIGTFYFNDHQILLLQWIDAGRRTIDFWKLFGEQLARMHLWRDTVAGYQQTFGFKEDNYMGALPQCNQPMSNWCDFFREQRLKPQLELATKQGLMPSALLADFDKLYQKLPSLFPDEPASFLHGDLWSGNFLCNTSNEPVLIDPAVYFGHRSVDLGMTTLFGGFEEAFYEAYAYWYPLPSNYREQWEVCNLYPLLIHLNLFGRTYLSSIDAIVRRFR